MDRRRLLGLLAGTGAVGAAAVFSRALVTLAADKPAVTAEMISQATDFNLARPPLGAS